MPVRSKTRLATAKKPRRGSDLFFDVRLGDMSLDVESVRKNFERIEMAIWARAKQMNASSSIQIKADTSPTCAGSDPGLGSHVSRKRAAIADRPRIKAAQMKAVTRSARRGLTSTRINKPEKHRWHQTGSGTRGKKIIRIAVPTACFNHTIFVRSAMSWIFCFPIRISSAGGPPS